MKTKPLYHAHLITYKKALEMNLYTIHIRARPQFRDRNINIARGMIALSVKMDRKKKRLAA